MLIFSPFFLFSFIFSFLFIFFFFCLRKCAPFGIKMEGGTCPCDPFATGLSLWIIYIFFRFVIPTGESELTVSGEGCSAFADVISGNPLQKDWHVRFTTVPFKAVYNREQLRYPCDNFYIDKRYSGGFFWSLNLSIYKNDDIYYIIYPIFWS